jgi:hypothetical protein
VLVGEHKHCRLSVMFHGPSGISNALYVVALCVRLKVLFLV